jgi:hypothetical protein
MPVNHDPNLDTQVKGSGSKNSPDRLPKRAPRSHDKIVGSIKVRIEGNAKGQTLVTGFAKVPRHLASRQQTSIGEQVNRCPRETIR